MRRRRVIRRSAGISSEALDAYLRGDDAALRAALKLKPWQYPTLVGDRERCPYPAETAAAAWYPEARELRRKLERLA